MKTINNYTGKSNSELINELERMSQHHNKVMAQYVSDLIELLRDVDELNERFNRIEREQKKLIANARRCA